MTGVKTCALTKFGAGYGREDRKNTSTATDVQNNIILEVVWVNLEGA